MVNAGSVAVDGGCGLSAEVSVAGVEVKGADVMGAAGAAELHASLDAAERVISFHRSSVIFCCQMDRHEGEAAKVTIGKS